MEDDLISNNNSETEDYIDVSENKYESKALKLQEMITHFGYSLSGYSLTDNGEKYTYEGDISLGDKLIKDIMNLLLPFSREINMISNKSTFSWEKQKLRTRISFIKLVVPAVDGDAQKYHSIWRSFSNILANIGDIIVAKNSQGFLKGFFGFGQEQTENFNNYNREKKEEGKLI